GPGECAASTSHPRPVGWVLAEPGVVAEGPERAFSGAGAVGRAPNDRGAGAGDREFRAAGVLVARCGPGQGRSYQPGLGPSTVSGNHAPGRRVSGNLAERRWEARQDPDLQPGGITA